MKAPLAVAALALLPLLAPAPALGEPPMAVEIERKVEADVFEGPSYPSAEGGAGPACPRGFSKARTGDSVVLTVAPQKGRRDQPDFSLIVRIDRGVAYLLFHLDRSFAELEHPFKEPPFPFPVEIDKESQRRLAPRLLHPAAPERRTLGALQAVVLSNVVGDENRSHADIEAVYEAAPRPLAGVSHRLEEFFQDMGPGRSWLRLLGEQGGLLLGWAQATYLPEDKVHYRERFAALREVPARPDLFEPPAGYRRVKLDPVCFFGL
jgi:hypothetical protein